MALKKQQKIFKISAIALGILVAVLYLFHLWFLKHASVLLDELVQQQSAGQVRGSIGKIKINYYTLRIDLENVELHPTDTLNESAKGRFKSSRLSLKVKSFWPAILYKRIEIDSIVCEKPFLETYKHKPKEHKKISIPEEVGKIYLNIQHAVNGLQIKRLQIDDGTISISDRTIVGSAIQITGIWFSLDNLKIDTGSIDNQPLFFSDNIDLRTGKQDLEWEDGNRKLRFKSLHLNTKANFLHIKDCLLSRHIPDSSNGGSYDMFFDELRLINPDLKSLYLTGAISADSVFCKRPDFKMEIRVKDNAQKKKNSDKSFERTLHTLSGDIQLKHLHVEDASISMILKKGNERKTFSSTNNNFSFSDIAVRRHDEQPIFIGHINMSIQNYLGYSSDSAFSVSFDSIRFHNNKVLLSNLSLSSFPTDIRKASTTMTIPSFEMDEVSWADLLFNKRIIARNAVLYRPHVVIESEKKQSAHKASTVFEVLDHISEMIKLDRFRLIDGKVDYTAIGGLKLQLVGLHAVIDTRMILEAENHSTIENAVSMLKFSRGTAISRNIEMYLHDAHFDGTDQSLAIRQLQVLSNQKDLQVYAEGVHIREILSDSVSIQADGISWENATVKKKLSAEKNAVNKRKILYTLKNIKGRNTSVQLETADSKIETYLEQVNLPSFDNANGIEVGIGALVQGKNFLMKGPINMECRAYSIQGRGQSVLSDLRVERYLQDDSLNAFVSKIEFVPHIHEMSTGLIELEEIAISKPVIRLVKTQQPNAATGAKEHKPIPKLNIGQVRIINPIVHINIEKPNGRNEVIIPVPKAGSPETLIQMASIRSNTENVLNIKDILMKVQEFTLRGDSTSILCQREGNLDLRVLNASYKPATSKSTAEWAGFMKRLSTNYLLFDRVKAGKNIHLLLRKAELDSVTLRSDKLKPEGILSESQHMSIKQLSGNLKTAATELSWHNVEYDRFRRLVKLDTLEYSPAISRDSFVRVAVYEPTYIKAKIHNVTIQNVDLPAYFRDSVLKLHKIILHEPELIVYKDKTIPFNPGNVKPLPVNLIKSIPILFSLDTLILSNGVVRYAERAKKTKLEGSVFLTRLNATLYPVTNYQLKDSDSLNLRAEAYLIDTALIKLRLRESYTDSLAGFVMTVQMPPANLTILNSIIEPTASIKIVSGYLDTLYMHAVGREYLSIGTMNMHYHKLKIQYLKGGKEESKNLLTGLVTFVANSVVKTNNDHRKGQVYFMRDRHRQVINYWVKMTLSGVATSVGVKHSKKYLRQYKKELEQQHLPPINF